MTENSNNNNLNNNNVNLDVTDTTSFSKIIQGVKRLREQSQEQVLIDNINKSKPVTHYNQAGTTTRVYGDLGETVISASSPSSSSTSSKTYHRPARLISPRINTGDQYLKNVQINNSQKGNPLLKNLKIGYEFNANLKNCDYLINPKVFVLFLSLKYHKLHPEYIYNKIRKFNGNNYQINNNMKVLLCVVDIENNNDIIRELNKICLLNDLSLVLAWSFEEASNYLNYLKQLENNNEYKQIKGTNTNKDDYYQILANTLTTIRQINKTDTINLISKYGSFKDLINLSNSEDLFEVQGMGKVKINKFLSTIDENFILNKDYSKNKIPESNSKNDSNNNNNNNSESATNEFDQFLEEIDL